MKSKFLTYALLFALLVIVFQYANSKRIIDKYEKDIKTYQSKIEQLETKNFELEAKLKEV
jgi:cell division protein FtsB